MEARTMLLDVLQECQVSQQCGGVRVHAASGNKSKLALCPACSPTAEQVPACSFQVKEDGSVRPGNRLCQELLDCLTQLNLSRCCGGRLGMRT